MKKTLLAFAVLGAFAGVASAQSSVTIYGVVDASISNNNGGVAGGSVTKLDSGSQSGSRLGFKGTEDLGGGLAAIFVLENGFNVDDGSLGGTNQLFGRQAFVGLTGGFGQVRFGRQKNVLYDTLDAIDPFHIGMAGDAWRLFAQYGKRSDNTMTYITPNLSGFAAQVSYSLGEVAGNNSAARQIGANATYTNGPIYVALAYHEQKNALGTDEGKTTLLGGTYDFAVVKAHLGYAINKGVGTLDTRDVLAGVTVPFGPHAILADYIRKTDKHLSNADVDQYAIGYTYALSKRTNLYSSYSYTSNDNAVKYNAAVLGGTAKLFNVGVRHTF